MNEWTKGELWKTKLAATIFSRSVSLSLHTQNRKVKSGWKRGGALGSGLGFKLQKSEQPTHLGADKTPGRKMTRMRLQTRGSSNNDVIFSFNVSFRIFCIFCFFPLRRPPFSTTPLSLLLPSCLTSSLVLCRAFIGSSMKWLQIFDQQYPQKSNSTCMH